MEERKEPFELSKCKIVFIFKHGTHTGLEMG